MIESDHAADDRRRCASATVAQDFVPVAHLFAREIEKLRATNSRLARQPVAGTVRHESEIARLQDVILGALHIQDAPARRHDMEHQAVLERRQIERPGSRELGATVKNAAHP